MVDDCGPVGRVLWVVCLQDGSHARRMGVDLLVSAIIEKAEFVCSFVRTRD